MSPLKQSLPGDTFTSGDVLNNTYTIEGVLGRGYTSEVYLAHNTLSGQAALKVLKSKFAGDEGFVDLIRRELETHQIRHNAIVGYRDGFLTKDGHICIVMDYVKGQTLADNMRRHTFETDELLTIALRLADGLSEAHRHGIIHRDLSPDNIILQNDDAAQAVIIDFGIAKNTNPEALTVVGSEFAGKYQYAAPEQLDGHVDERSDLYALGACLLAAYRRRPPDIGSNFASIQKNKSEPLDVSGVPEPLRGLIVGLVQVDPAERFPTAEAVSRHIAGLEQSNKDKQNLTGRSAWPKKALVGVSILLFAGVGAWVWREDPFGFQAPPSIDVFEVTAERTSSGKVSVKAHVPNTADANTLMATVQGLGGKLDFDLASGVPSPTWTGDVIATLSAISPLSEWSLNVSGQSAKINGMASDLVIRRDVMNAINASEGARFFDFEVTIRLPSLTIEDVKSELASLAECGPLHLVNPPLAVFTADDAISVAGKLSGPLHEQKITNRINKISAGRPLKLETSFLNPALCVMEGVLPPTPACTASVRFGYGDRLDVNPKGIYAEGDNPTIDVVTAADSENGHLYVFVVDVTGNAYSLLPTRAYPETRVAELGRLDDANRLTRVAFSLAEREVERERLAFLIDNTFGESRLYVVHTRTPVFDYVRPFSESAESLRHALLNEVDWTNRGVLSICSFKIGSR